MGAALLTRLLQAGAKVIQQVDSWEVKPSNMLTRMPEKVVAKVKADGIDYRITVQEWVEKETKEDELSKRL